MGETYGGNLWGKPMGETYGGNRPMGETAPNAVLYKGYYEAIEILVLPL